jgi:hypothetical protein
MATVFADTSESVKHRRKQMVDPFEIFGLDAEGQYDWIATAPSFADATKLMCKHAANFESIHSVHCFSTNFDTRLTFHKTTGNGPDGLIVERQHLLV